ncbi:MAG: choice-of-anchor B family protein [Saprospiraceae bacterium]|nr:choice-of-anchor B family protein [Saprospiraceae bacterium]
MNKFIGLVLVLFYTTVSAQDGDLNMTIVAKVPEATGGSGIWHYYDPIKKIEYAVLGSKAATIIYSLEDPTKPIERFRLPGGQTIWREVFSYGKFVYAVTDVNADDGLAIIDMSKAPDTIKGSFWKPSVTAGGKTEILGKCHTLFIDEKGILSLNGCTPWSGTLFFDLKPDPKNPKFIGSTLKRYCHDNYVRRDTVYSSEINDGKLTMYDARDYKNVVEIASFNTPNNFNHNSWLSNDSKYIFTTDEREDAFVASYDISDLKKITLLDKYKPKDTENTGVIPHNTRYLNGYLITSYYTDGVKIVDAHRPDNLIEVGSIDTYLGQGTGFNGCWGVSPYLPSGLIIASNIPDGLYVIKPTYVRACYLEGLVTDTITGFPILDARIVVKALRKNYDFSNIQGIYKTGYATAGEYEVEFSHPDYFPKTVKVSLLNGEVTIKDVQLISRRPTITAKVIVKDSITGLVMNNAHVRITNTNTDKSANTMADGVASLFIFQDSIPYEVVVGKWGYRHKKVIFQSDKQSGNIEILVRKGYQDDFIFDQGWTVSSTASAGKWAKGEPIGSLYRSEQFQPEFDIVTDFGNECYVTGNTGGDPSLDDVDNGATTLTSPVMKLSNYKEPILSFYHWFVNASGQGAPNDRMNIRLSNGSTIVFVKEITNNSPNWIFSEFIKVKDLLPLTDSMRLIVDIADDNPGHLVDGAFDGFLLVDAIISYINSNNNEIAIKAFPNSFSHQTHVAYKTNENQSYTLKIQVSDQYGRIIQEKNLNEKEGLISLGEDWNQGFYVLRIFDQYQSKSITLVKI